MFCTNCGTNIPDDSSFCPGCGANINAAQANVQPQAPVYQQAPVQQQTPVYQQAPIQQQAPIYQQAPTYQQAPVYQQGPYPQKPSKKKGWIIALIIGIVAIAIIGILVFVLTNSKNKSPEDIVEKLEKAYNKQELEYIYDTLPHFEEKSFRHDIKYYYDSEEEFWEEVFYYDLYVDPEIFSSIKTDFQIVDKERGDRDDCEEWEYELEEYYDENFSISAIYDLEIEITYTLQVDKKYCKNQFGSDYKEILEDEFGRNWEKGITETVYVEAITYETDGECFLLFYDAF